MLASKIDLGGLCWAQKGGLGGVITTMVNQPKWLRKPTKKDPKLASRDHLGGDLGAMLASEIGLGGLCWAPTSV